MTTKSSAKASKKELTTLEDNGPTQDNGMVAVPSSIADKYSFKQLNYNFLIPEVGVPCYIKFLEKSCDLKKVPNIQDPCHCTKVVNIETGEEFLFVLKKVLIKTLTENGLVKEDKEGNLDLSKALERVFAIVVQENKTSKAGRAYTPYTVIELQPKEVTAD